MLEFNLKIGYLSKKKMKKLYGRMIGCEIAFGRNLLKIIRKSYSRNEK